MKYVLFLLFSLFFVHYVQAVGVKGKITNKEGEPLAFTTIQVVQTEESTISNVNGEYKLDLSPGQYTLIFRYMGYKTVQKEIAVTQQYITVDLTMIPQTYVIGEFNYEAGEQDESYAIMQKAIALAKIHRISVQEYSARFYVKGTFVLEKIPWVLRKAMESEGVNLSEGTTYVSESVNKVEYKRPNSLKQRVISSRSNLPEELSEPSLPFVQADFYRPKVGDFVSPVHPSAFSVYNFKYEGTFQDGEHQVVRIKVTPKRGGPNRYSGHINLVEPSYAFHSLNLTITDENKVEYQLKQVYAPFDGVWMPVSQRGKVAAKTFGVEINASYVTSTSDYEITTSEAFETLPNNEREMEAIIENREDEEELTSRKTRRKVRAFKKQERKAAKERGEDIRIERIRVFKVDSNAQSTPDSVWNSLRQVPLTKEEEKGYALADSMHRARLKQEQADSTRRTQGFKPLHVITGGDYDWGEDVRRFTKEHTVNFQGLIGGLSDFDIYNTVDGFVLKTGVEYLKQRKDRIAQRTGLEARYAFSRQAFNANIYREARLFNDQLYYRIEGGRQVDAINGDAGINNLLNLGYTWFMRENFLKLYEKNYARLKLAQKVGDRLVIRGDAEIAQRFALENNSFRYVSSIFGGTFTSNTPENKHNPQTLFEDHTMLLSSLQFIWRPFAGVNLINDQRYLDNSNRPKFIFSAYAGHLADEFYRGEVTVEHKLNVGLIGKLNYSITGGSFIGSSPKYLIDHYHFTVNQTIFSGSPTRFRQLDYFLYSAPSQYFQGFSSMEFSRLALTNFNTLNMAGWKESLFCNHAMASKLSYTEFGYRLSGVFRAFGIDIYAGILNGSYDYAGVRFLFKLD